MSGLRLEIKQERPTIFLIEGDEALRRMFEELLSGAGEVITPPLGRLTVSEVQAVGAFPVPPAVVVLDVDDGLYKNLPLSWTLAALRRVTKVVLLGGGNGQMWEEFADARGHCDAWFEKPVDTPRLLETVRLMATSQNSA